MGDLNTKKEQMKIEGDYMDRELDSAPKSQGGSTPELTLEYEKKLIEEITKEPIGSSKEN